MVGADVDPVEAGARPLELGVELTGHGAEDILVEVPARDARLVGHHHGRDVGGVETADRLARARQESQPLRVIDVPDFLGERAVTIDEDRGPGCHALKCKRPDGHFSR